MCHFWMDACLELCVPQAIKKPAFAADNSVAQRMLLSKLGRSKLIIVHGQPVRMDRASRASPAFRASYEPHALARPFSTMLAHSCIRWVSQLTSCVQVPVSPPPMAGSRSSTRRPCHLPPRQRRTTYAPAGLTLSCPGSRARTKRPPSKSASAAREEMNQQLPSTPCCTSSARGMPRNSWKSVFGAAPKNSQAQPPHGLPACAVISFGLTHFVALPCFTRGKVGSTKA
mmetsp:Transcript_73898/g.190714  ORF Transcript_73898/g.190714 Transcript_73898/m.190714 type:complete len:228 (+) Transcript_73898:983-1666(+)